MPRAPTFTCAAFATTLHYARLIVIRCLPLLVIGIASLVCANGNNRIYESDFL